MDYEQLENKRILFKDASSGLAIKRECIIIVRVRVAIVGLESGAFYRSLTNLAEQASPVRKIKLSWLPE